MNNPKIFLFYCNRCVHSKKIITKINNLNIQDKFLKCDIDNKALKIPPQIKVVPTVFIPSPSGSKLIVSPELDSWIEEFAMSQGGGTDNRVQMDNRGQPETNNVMPSSGGMISDWDAVEMGGTYASIIDNTSTVTGGFQYINKHGDYTQHPMERGQPQLTGMGENIINGEGNGKDQKKGELDKKFEDFMAARNMDIEMNQAQRF